MVRPKENRCNEGPFVFKYNKKYYMTYAGGNTSFPTYGIGYCTADNPMGPWKKATENPILIRDIKNGVSGPGHNSVVKSPDGKEMFIVYHTHADVNKPEGDRVVNIDRLIITKDGKMKVNGPTRTPQLLPSGVK
jgi:GH43 family beta-xylosidase